jgi:hypothetical protein
MLTPLSRSEKPHLWLIGLSHDGRMSSLAGLYPILSALGFVPETGPTEGEAEPPGAVTRRRFVVRNSGARVSRKQ